MPRLKANITPEVIKWARKSCHYSIEEAAQKIGRSSTELEAWEEGESKPSIAQARKASEVYKRPLAVFFLPQPPKDFSTLRDFRKLPADVPREYSPNLVFLIRLIQERQSWLSGYLRDEGFSPVEFIGSASVKVNSVKLASQIRNTLGVNQDKIRKCRNRGDALRLWVDATENMGVFVFQSGNMQYEKIAVEEARGFALTEQYAPFVFLNYQDAKVAQIFTLAHELAHLWINEPGVSNLAPRGRTLKGAGEIEVFCNYVAAEVILPQSEFLEYWRDLDRSDILEGRIDNSSKHFKVSKEVIARRLLNQRIISQNKYIELAERFYREWLEYKKKEKRRMAESKRIPHPYRTKLINNGRAFSRVVLGAFQGGRLSGRDMSHLLGIKINKISKYAEFAGMKISSGRINT